MFLFSLPPTTAEQGGGDLPPTLYPALRAKTRFAGRRGMVLPGPVFIGAGENYHCPAFVRLGLWLKNLISFATDNYKTG